MDCRLNSMFSDTFIKSDNEREQFKWAYFSTWVPNRERNGMGYSLRCQFALEYSCALAWSIKFSLFSRLLRLRSYPVRLPWLHCFLSLSHRREWICQLPIGREWTTWDEGRSSICKQHFITLASHLTCYHSLTTLTRLLVMITHSSSTHLRWATTSTVFAFSLRTMDRSGSERGQSLRERDHRWERRPNWGGRVVSWNVNSLFSSVVALMVNYRLHLSYFHMKSTTVIQA